MRNPIDDLRRLADWAETRNVTASEIVSLDCEPYQGARAHLHFRALLRLWPGRTFDGVTFSSIGDERPHVRFEDDGVTVVCLVEEKELAEHGDVLRIAETVA